MPLLLTGVAGTSCVASAVPAAARQPASSCTGYRPPDPNRPAVTLGFAVGPDHRTVTGREHIVFRPDREIRELVFRLWPNGPEGGRTHASLTVLDARVEGRRSRLHLMSAGGRPGTQGTLLSLPLPAPAPAGTPVNADLSFTVRLPPPSWDRMGSDGQTAWWASAHPMLAWQSGVGWTRDPASPLPGETATSEAAATDVTVTAPANDQVLTGGLADPPQPAPGGRRRWHFRAPTARDVAVAVGPFRLTSAQIAVPAGPPVAVTVAVAPRLSWAGPDVLAEVRRALPRLAAQFGPVPFPALRLAGLPGLIPSGIEYPAMMLLLGSRPPQDIVTHELAHQWFYALVGNNQARDPWLDEAFATYAETLLDTPPVNDTPWFTAAGRVGASMASFGTDYPRYTDLAYDQGAAALRTARQRAGPAFDTAVRCYLTDLAWQIATPADLAAHLRHLPAALAILRQAGAL